MGLDMYLEAERYASGYRHSGDEDKRIFNAVLDVLALRDVVDPNSRSAKIRVTVAYWRKANAIHRWFVEHVQDGTDDCGDYYVTHDQLKELRDTCVKALEVADISEKQPVHNGTSWDAEGQHEHFVEGRAALNGEALAAILPTERGFFFGSTDYDEWYFRDLEYTIEQIDRVLTNVPDGWGWSLYYHSSW